MGLSDGLTLVGSGDQESVQRETYVTTSLGSRMNSLTDLSEIDNGVLEIRTDLSLVFGA
jgi:hypothetical protein